MSEKGDKVAENISEIFRFIVFLALLYGAWTLYSNHKENERISIEKYNTQIEQLESTKFHITKNIKDGGELHKAVSLFSDYTTVQSKEVIKRYTGEFVGAEARVANISERDNGNFMIYTSTVFGIDFTIEAHPIDASNRQYILSLRKGSLVRFMGYISGMGIGNLSISPAIIVQPGKQKPAMGAKKRGNFKFISCEINEASIYIINLQDVKTGKEYSMVADGDIYDSLCKKIKNGTVIKVDYKHDIESQGPDEEDEFEADIILGYSK